MLAYLQPLHFLLNVSNKYISFNLHLLLTIQAAEECFLLTGHGVEG